MKVAAQRGQETIYATLCLFFVGLSSIEIFHCGAILFSAIVTRPVDHSSNPVREKLLVEDKSIDTTIL